MYHAGFNTLPGNPPDLTAADRAMLNARRPAEVLLYDTSAASFPTALRNLSDFQSALIRATVLRSGSLVLHVWLIRLGRYYDAQKARIDHDRPVRHRLSASPPGTSARVEHGTLGCPGDRLT